MLARIAHELYWLGRYLVRAEHTARMLDGVFQADVQGRPDAPPGVDLSWPAMLAIMGAGQQPSATRDEVLERLTLDPTEPTSVRSCVSTARESARTVRDTISAEMWEAVNTFHLGLSQRDLPAALRTGPYSVNQFVKERCALFWGLAERTMLRDEARAFLVAGGRIEAADMVLRMLRVALPPIPEHSDGAGSLRDGQALALLQAVGGFQAFRRAVATPPNAVPVARFLLFERDYPYSIASSVDALQALLSNADSDPRVSAPVLRLRRLAADLEFRGRTPGDDRLLLETFAIVAQELASVDRDVADRYFAGAAPVEHQVTHPPIQA